jgi:hypothetical protein
MRPNDYLARDYESLLHSMRELIPELLPEWTDFRSEADFGNVLLQLFAHMGDILSYYQDRVANESFLGTARSRRSVIHHLRLIGYRLATASPAAAKLRLVVPAGLQEPITIRPGDAFATKSGKDVPSLRFEFTGPEDLVIEPGQLLEPLQDPAKRYFDGVSVEEGRLIKQELLGHSDGTPNQRFPLLHAGIIVRSLGLGQSIHRDIHLTVGESPEPWNLQETLAFSRNDQPDFSLDIDEQDRATILFGDGDFGAIPAKGEAVRATYRIGGGRQGNVAAHAIQTIMDAPQLALLGAKVTNPAPATGGSDRETIEHAVRHAPGVFRSMKRAVTAEDFEALALSYRGVGKVRAEPAGFNTVRLYVAPEGGGYVSDILEKNLLALFEDKRMLSTLIEIRDVAYVDLFITAEVDVKRYHSREDVREQVVRAAQAVLDFDAVDFAEVIYLSKFYEAIEAVDGVQGVHISEFRTGAQPAGSIEPTGKIGLKANEIPRPPGGLAGKGAYASGLQVILRGGQ